MTTTSEPLEPTELSAPARSVRRVRTLERVLAGEPEVVAGAGQLDRPVRWAHVAEAPDVGVVLTGGEMVLTGGEMVLTGGEMVLTTGVLLAGDEDKQAEYIRSLHRAEAAAVVLGLGRAFPAPPEVMRRADERCVLPRMILHRLFPVAELTEEVQCRLARRKFAAVSLSESVRTTLTALITAGAPLQSPLDEVASHSACPVVVTDLAQRVLATAGERSAVDDVLRDWERIARQAGGSEGDGWIRAEPGGRGERWRPIMLCGHRGDTATGRLLADRAAEALVLHRMLGGNSAHTCKEQSAQSLLTDLVSGVVPARQLLPRAGCRAAGQPVRLRAARCTGRRGGPTGACAAAAGAVRDRRRTRRRGHRRAAQPRPGPGHSRAPVRRGGGERQGERTRRPRPGPGQAPRGPRPLAVLPRPGPGDVWTADSTVQAPSGRRAKGRGAALDMRLRRASATSRTQPPL